MNNSSEQLIAVLQNEFDAHKRLVVAAQDMNQAVKGGQLDKILAASRAYDASIFAIAELEEKRLEISDAICQGETPNSPHASLLRVISKAPAEYKKPIADLRENLRSEIINLSKVNYANQVLLTETLRSIQQTFEMIATVQASKLGGYKNQGKKETPRASIALINTTA